MRSFQEIKNENRHESFIGYRIMYPRYTIRCYLASYYPMAKLYDYYLKPVFCYLSDLKKESVCKKFFKDRHDWGYDRHYKSLKYAPRKRVVILRSLYNLQKKRKAY